MKSIRERARDYVKSEGGIGLHPDDHDFIEEAFVVGAKSEHKELTKWNSPDNPPENDTPVLLKAIWKAGGLIYYRVGRYRCGEYINDSCPSHNIDVIGWREIHE